MTRRRSHFHHAAPALVIVGLLASAVAAQSLGDVAKKTAADQEKTRNTPATTAAKPTPKATNEAPKKLPPCDGDTEASRTAPAASGRETKRDQEYWKGRMRTLKAQLKTDQHQLSAASVRLAEYQAALAKSERAINGDVYVDRTLQLQVMATRTEISRLTALVASDRHQVAELEEDARQAGVPPGWLRQ